jgi:cell wall-associated NlpC family hydrolase
LVPSTPDAGPQYARLVVAADADRDVRPGDFVIFRPHVGQRAPKGRVDVRRRKGRLAESAIWNSDGRKLTSDSAALDEQETIEFDPDDEGVVIEGVAIAVFRRL